jgi:hypothetical protein
MFQRIRVLSLAPASHRALILRAAWILVLTLHIIQSCLRTQKRAQNSEDPTMEDHAPT